MSDLYIYLAANICKLWLAELFTKKIFLRSQILSFYYNFHFKSFHFKKPFIDSNKYD